MRIYHFGSEQQQALLEDLLMLLGDGISVTEACDWMRRRAKGLRAECIDDMLSAIARGHPIADGLARHFPIHIVEAIRAGEHSGQLLAALRTSIDSIAARSQLRYTLFETLSYPIVVVVMSLLVLVFLKHSILDDFNSLLPEPQWPEHAQWLWWTANGLEHWWWLVIAIAAGITIAVRTILLTYVGHLRAVIDKLPLLKLYRLFIAAHFMQTLGLLIANGMMLKSALDILKKTAPPYLSAHLLRMEYRLAKGSDRIGDVLNTGLIQEEDIQRLELILETRNLEKALVTLGQNAAVQGQRRIKHSGRLLGYTLLLFCGLLAMMMIISIYDVGMAVSTTMS